MNPRNILVPVLVALAAGSFAGCGDDDKKADGGSTASTPAPAPTTPEGSWAQELCTAMVGKATTVQPPNVEGNDPKKTKTALVTFFTDIGGQLEEQVKTVEQVGPPPGSAAAEDWEKAVDRMRDVNRDIAKLRREIRGTSVDSQADIQAVIADLGKQMGKFTEYQGPVAELKESKTIATALTDDPACAEVS